MQDHKIPGQKLYRLSPAEDKELQKQLSSLEKLGFIEPSVLRLVQGCFLCLSQMGSFDYVWTIDL